MRHQTILSALSPKFSQLLKDNGKGQVLAADTLARPKTCAKLRQYEMIVLSAHHEEEGKFRIETQILQCSS